MPAPRRTRRDEDNATGGSPMAMDHSGEEALAAPGLSTKYSEMEVNPRLELWGFGRGCRCKDFDASGRSYIGPEQGCLRGGRRGSACVAQTRRRDQDGEEDNVGRWGPQGRETREERKRKRKRERRAWTSAQGKKRKSGPGQKKKRKEMKRKIGWRAEKKNESSQRKRIQPEKRKSEI